MYVWYFPIFTIVIFPPSRPKAVPTATAWSTRQQTAPASWKRSGGSRSCGQLATPRGGPSYWWGTRLIWPDRELFLLMVSRIRRWVIIYYNFFFVKINNCIVCLVVKIATAEKVVLGSIPGLDKVLINGFFHQECLSNTHEVCICAQLMAIGSPLITWNLKT